MATVAGVNVLHDEQLFVAFCAAHMLSSDGMCKTFDSRADGYGRGEGCGAIVLKRLGDARRDGDRVLAVIKGTSINQDGRSATLTAPNGPAQVAVIRAALREAGLQGRDVDYIETHGTGHRSGRPDRGRGAAAGCWRRPQRGPACGAGCSQDQHWAPRSCGGYRRTDQSCFGVAASLCAAQRALRQLNPRLTFRVSQSFCPALPRDVYRWRIGAGGWWPASAALASAAPMPTPFLSRRSRRTARPPGEASTTSNNSSSSSSSNKHWQCKPPARPCPGGLPLHRPGLAVSWYG